MEKSIVVSTKQGVKSVMNYLTKGSAWRVQVDSESFDISNETDSAGLISYLMTKVEEEQSSTVTLRRVN